MKDRKPVYLKPILLSFFVGFLVLISGLATQEVHAAEPDWYVEQQIKKYHRKNSDYYYLDGYFYMQSYVTDSNPSTYYEDGWGKWTDSSPANIQNSLYNPEDIDGRREIYPQSRDWGFAPTGTVWMGSKKYTPSGSPYNWRVRYIRYAKTSYRRSKTSPSVNGIDQVSGVYAKGNEYWAAPNDTVQIRVRGYQTWNGYGKNIQLDDYVDSNNLRLVGGDQDIRSAMYRDGHINNFRTDSDATISKNSSGVSSDKRTLFSKFNVVAKRGAYNIHTYVTSENGKTQGYVDTGKNLRIDGKAPDRKDYTVYDARYVDGNNYWYKSGDSFRVRLVGFDDESGMRNTNLRLYGDGNDNRAVHYWDQYDGYVNEFNTGEYTDITSGTSPYSGWTAEYIFGGKIHSNIGNRTFEVQDFFEDNVRNSVGYTDTGLRIKTDDTAPTGTIVQDDVDFTEDGVTLTVLPVDHESGYQRTKLPDGTYTNSTSPSYKVSSNGTYDFVIYDNVGNTKTISKTVTTIDVEAPDIDITKTPTDWTNQSVKVSVKGTDTQSGVDQIEQVDQSTLTGRNFLLNSQLDYTTVNNLDWDAALNGNLIPAYGFTNGYNGGVTDPTVGYHAHLNANKFSYPVLEFMNRNSQYGDPNRWLGISQGFNASSDINKELEVGSSITVSFDLQSDKIGGTIDGGLHRYSKSTGTTSFVSRDLSVSTKANGWERFSFTQVVDDDWDLTKSFRLYLYGHLDDEITKYVKNIKVELGDRATPDSIAPEDVSLVNDTKVYDVAENGTYTYRVTDKVGNSRDASVTIDNIDSILPTGSSTRYKGWTNDNVWIDVIGQDEESGLDRIEYVGGGSISDAPIREWDGQKSRAERFTATENGTYRFKITDRAGNTEEVIQTVTNIDRTVPDLTIEQSDSWVNTDVPLTAVMSDRNNQGDRISGAYEIYMKREDGTQTDTYVVEDSENTTDTFKQLFTATENGTYTFVLTDRAGNVTEVDHEVTTIDRTDPIGDLRILSDFEDEEVQEGAIVNLDMIKDLSARVQVSVQDMGDPQSGVDFIVLEEQNRIARDGQWKTVREHTVDWSDKDEDQWVDLDFDVDHALDTRFVLTVYDRAGNSSERMISNTVRHSVLKFIDFKITDVVNPELTDEQMDAIKETDLTSGSIPLTAGTNATFDFTYELRHLDEVVSLSGKITVKTKSPNGEDIQTTVIQVDEPLTGHNKPVTVTESFKVPEGAPKGSTVNIDGNLVAEMENGAKHEIFYPNADDIGAVTNQFEEFFRFRIVR